VNRHPLRTVNGVREAVGGSGGNPQGNILDIRTGLCGSPTAASSAGNAAGLAHGLPSTAGVVRGGVHGLDGSVAGDRSRRRAATPLEYLATTSTAEFALPQAA
jgi:hypothetical protein